MSNRDLPLDGYRIGVTAARKVEEQIALLERRGAKVDWAPVLSSDPNQVDDAQLRTATEAVLAEPIDIFVATTGIGMKTRFEATEEWGLHDRLVAAISASEVLARGPKSVGALRRRGIRELWAPDSECFEDVLAHLRGRDPAGMRIVVQEHGQSLSMVAHALQRRGARVDVVTVYRVASAGGSGADVPDGRPDRRSQARRGHLHLRPRRRRADVGRRRHRSPRRGRRRLPGPTSSRRASVRSPPPRSRCGECRRSCPSGRVSPR
ncbi:uroporphyrinogen-III synthase [Nocardioides sp. B-3]|uniref:uroporphyrinogen-III synthase n=1 Tax=Nocardioides sp. B-3 TaxID=2895565 RepID=UPI00215382A1|nr:uroporphyrinogen-III synthase [Nocardioides sp. B-3]UUZ57719.1 uroporphyrinogen-III synthase [Nocardioides sp. B-3]